MRRQVILGIVSALIAVAATIHLMPPTDDFSPSNPLWNGLSRACEMLNLKAIEDLRGAGNLEPSSTAILILAPSKPFSDEETGILRGFISRGGLLIIADDFGTGNELLSSLGLNLRLNGSILLDPLFKYRSRRLPKIIQMAGELTPEVEELILNYATIITGSGFRTLAASTSFSFLDLNGNSEWDAGEPQGPLPVAAEAAYGGGRVIVISDPSIMINSMIGMGGNGRFIAHLIGGRSPLLDTSHWVPSPLSRAKGVVGAALGAASIPEARYTLTALAATLIFKLEYKRVRVRMSRLEEVLRRHPDWDRDVLSRLEEEIALEG